MKISKFFVWVALFGASVGRAEVVAEQLPEMKVGTIGVETGLSPDIWGDKPDAESILAQIKNVEKAPLNDSEKEILKRVLLTDMGGVVALEERGEEYLQARVEAFVAQGMMEEALVLLNQVPTQSMSNTQKQLKAEVLFVAGRAEEACAESSLEAFGSEEAFIRAACADVMGVPPASALAYEVYRESEKDTHPFLNAAGEMLYRDITASMPEGVPSVWEMPVIARVWGVDILKLPLSKKHLWVLVGQERVPPEVRKEADNILKRVEKVPADGQILTHLTQMAEERRWIEPVLKGKNAK